MKVIFESGNDALAKVYVGQLADGNLIEFVESVQPPRTREEKWVNIISTMVGCPVGCRMCDAGGQYKRSLTAKEMRWQLETLASKNFPDGKITSKLWKIQLARMGEPTMNPEVLEFIEGLASKENGNLVLSLSTVAPRGCQSFLKKLKQVKDKNFLGRFQLQFSLHSTDHKARSQLIPVKTHSLKKIEAMGREFRGAGDKKITLNFMAVKGAPIDAEKVASIFDTENFLIKITPLNPTEKAKSNKLACGFDPQAPETASSLVKEFESKGYEVILSIGQLEENQIGSNCGMYVNRMKGREKSSGEC
jgi:23S rRNA (adenine2503-C2)-methyltransferase